MKRKMPNNRMQADGVHVYSEIHARFRRA